MKGQVRTSRTLGHDGATWIESVSDRRARAAAGDGRLSRKREIEVAVGWEEQKATSRWIRSVA